MISLSHILSLVVIVEEGGAKLFLSQNQILYSTLKMGGAVAHRLSPKAGYGSQHYTNDIDLQPLIIV